MRRKYLFAGQVGFLLIIVTTLYFEGHKLARLRPVRPFSTAGNNASADAVSTQPTPSAPVAFQPTGTGVFSAESLTSYVNAILDPESKVLPRLECPKIAGSSRYASLQKRSESWTRDDKQTEVIYFFAIDLREVVGLLPRLLGSVVEVVRFLGPEKCALSIVEGNSRDGTLEVLEALRPSLDALATTYYLQSSDVDPLKGDRITRLAELRDMALQPLRDEGGQRYSAKTTVIFLNDVAACPEDILELVHQRQVLGADMVCGLDWVYVGRDPTFYDVWVARGMGGDSFFEIPPDGNWNSAWNLFWNDDDGRSGYFEHHPFQVFSCWNGGAVFTAAPIVDGTIRFRGPSEGECKQGEPQLFCKDMWYHGYGKIAVVPTVNFEYSDDRAKQIKELKGYTSQFATVDAPNDKIDWKAEPPAMVKCIPSYEEQSFRPWDEALE
ncbi:alpha-mannosyltransferase [Grosmannia clavigera kw1407]|uniref:Alpha-mannosyltransferase n=1 Tax=Grosmannia clavigera (strain kw1407 / UAMH 11150) TaxID=655863 RepID=F0X900_GROCL|nr:alpha-mannosyltransferase [Grosmannia clavigera kw1407]EFX06014.1 alpha-mannosyltransferase [Grosmannia clavigera kw1407]